MGERRVPRLRWWIGAVVLLIVAWAVVVAVQLVRAEHQLRVGTAAAQQARAELSTATLTDAGASQRLAVAADAFGAAHADVSGFPVAPLGVVPILGTQIHSVTDLSGSAHALTDAGGRTLATARALLASPHQTPAERTRVIERLSMALDGLSQTVDHLDLGPLKGLVGPLATKRDLFAADVAKVQAAVVKADGAAAAASALLRGPSSELVVAANNAEMRAGTGMLLQAGQLEVRNGHLSLGAFRTVGVLRDPASRVRPTGDLATTWGFENPQEDFRTLFLSPDAPANDALAAAMWKERTGQRVDGVLGVDVAALADLLGVTGPVTVGPTTYTQANVTDQLLERQYVGLSGGEANVARRSQLGALAAAVVGRLQHGGYSLTGLISALDEAVDGRHLLAWSADPRVEADWVAAGAGGTVGDGDLLLGLLNLGGNKLDPYQQVTSTLTATPSGHASELEVQVRVTNTTPASVTGYAAGSPTGPALPRTYLGAVSLSIPPDATHITVTGTELLAEGPEGSAEQVAELFSVPDGATTTITVRFRLPGGTHGALVVLPSARLPPTTWIGPDGARFTDASAHTLRW